MGRLILVSGENNSGKSRFAEQLIAKMTGNRIYLATMRPCTEENYRRIARHKKQREGLHFQTLEVPFAAGEAPVSMDDVVLLEDVSNLLANVLFEKKGTVNGVYEDLFRLYQRVGTLVAVTITGLEPEAGEGDEAGYDEETKAYIRALNELNTRLEALADQVFVMQEGEAVRKKGDERCGF